MFSASDCRPCQQQKTQFQQLRAQGLEIHELDRDRDAAAFAHYGVSRTPTYILFADGAEVQRTGSLALLVTALKALVWVAHWMLF